MEAYPERFSPGVAELIRDRLFASAPQTGEGNPVGGSGKTGLAGRRGRKFRFDVL